MTALTQPLFARDPVYDQEFRLPKWTCRVSVARAWHCPLTAGRLLRRVLPTWTKEQHLEQARYHHARAKKLEKIWGLVWDRAFSEQFGRAPFIYDYRISGVGNDELPERHKRVLRYCAHTGSRHVDLARAHERAAGLRTRSLA